jgi:hypothetical protein
MNINDLKNMLVFLSRTPVTGIQESEVLLNLAKKIENQLKKQESAEEKDVENLGKDPRKKNNFSF